MIQAENRSNVPVSGKEYGLRGGILDGGIVGWAGWEAYEHRLKIMLREEE